MIYTQIYDETTQTYINLIAVKLGSLHKHEYFTLKPILYPKESQVYVKDSYDFSSKKYACYKFSDIISYKCFYGDKIVYVGFTF